MPYEIRTTLKLTMRLDELDVGVIAGADMASKMILADVRKTAADHGFAVETDGPKIVQVRARGEAEAEPSPRVDPGTRTEAAATAGDVAPPGLDLTAEEMDAGRNKLGGDAIADAEIPAHLRRKKGGGA